MTINGTGLGSQIAAVNVIAVPTERFLSAADIERLRDPQLIEHDEQQQDPLAAVAVSCAPPSTD